MMEELRTTNEHEFGFNFCAKCGGNAEVVEGNAEAMGSVSVCNDCAKTKLRFVSIRLSVVSL